MFRGLSKVLHFSLLLNFVAAAELPRVVIDGKPADAFWQQVHSGRLVPAEAGVPSEMGGEVRAVIGGGYLYLTARLGEPGGRVTARSTGRNPVWEGGGEARAVTEASVF
jgi:hypothetical protein